MKLSKSPTFHRVLLNARASRGDYLLALVDAEAVYLYRTVPTHVHDNCILGHRGCHSPVRRRSATGHQSSGGTTLDRGVNRCDSGKHSSDHYKLVAAWHPTS